jgi:thymidine kinase
MELDAILNDYLHKDDKSLSVKKEVIKESSEEMEDIDIEKITDVEKIKIALDILYNVSKDYYGLSKSIMLLTDIVHENNAVCPYCGEEDCVCDDEEEDEDEYDEDEDEEDYEEDEDEDEEEEKY